MRPRVLGLLICCYVAGVLVAGSCWDDDCHNHYDFNGHEYRHCHNDDHRNGNGHSGNNSQLTVVVTDHPIDDVEAFFVTITEVALDEEIDGSTSVYRSDTGRRIDLLSLRGDLDSRLFDLLAVEDLPPGVYESIRLTARAPEMHLASGEVLEGAAIDFVGDGAIEIELAQAIVLEPDDSVYVVLDFDVSASVLGRENDPTGAARRRVRPVILVDILYEDVEDVIRTPTDLRGRLVSRDRETGLFVVELPNDRGELDFRLIDDPTIVDHALNPRSIDSLVPGSDVRLRGYLTDAGDLEVDEVVLEPSGSAEKNRDAARSFARAVRSLEMGAATSIDVMPPPVQGIVYDIAPFGDALMLWEPDGSTRRVEISPETEIVIVDASEDGLWQTSIPASEVEIGMDAVAHGEPGFPARLLIVSFE